MAQNTHVINFLANAIGIKDAKNQLADMNRQIKLADGSTMNIVGLDKVRRDADGATTAVLRLKQQASGITGTAGVKFTQQHGRIVPAGTRFAPGARGGRGAFQSLTTGKFIKSPSGFEGGPIQAPTGKMSTEIDKTTLSTQNLDKASKGLLTTQIALGLRAAAVIPIWMAFRSIWSSLIGIVQGSITDWFALSEQMGRVATVTRGTTEDVMNLEAAALSFGAGSSASFADAAAAMYALGSAGLTVGQQMTGFSHVMDLAIGTMADVEQVAKLAAGSFNVFGKNMRGAATDGAKFKRIADLLAGTYATQQVELDEISTAMTFVASVGDLLNVQFEDLVTTIGVLNTGMLKGSKAGTSLLNAFVKLAQNADKLGELGVVFDPNQPLDFRDVITQLSDIYGDQALSLFELKEIMEVFGLRGGRAMASLIGRFGEWKKAIDNADEAFDGMAKKMKEEMENTLPAATKKLGNAIKANIIQQLEKVDIQKFLNDMARGLEKEAKGQAIITKFGQTVLPKNLRDDSFFLSSRFDRINLENRTPLQQVKGFLGQFFGGIGGAGIGPFIKHTTQSERAKAIGGLLKEGDVQILDIIKQAIDGKEKINALSEKEITLEVLLEDISQDRLKNDLDDVKAKQQILAWVEKNIVVSTFFNAANKEAQDKSIEAIFTLLAVKETELDKSKKLLVIDKERIQAAQDYVKSLEGAFATGLQTTLEEGGGFADLANKWTEALKSAQLQAFSTGAVEKLFEVGGFGGQLGFFGDQIRNAFRGPGKTTADYHATVVKNAIVSAANIHAGLLVGTSASKFADGGLGGGGGFFGFGGGSGAFSQPFGTTMVPGPNGTMVPISLLRNQGRARFARGRTGGQLLGAGAATALTGFATGSSFNQAAGGGGLGMAAGITGGIGAGVLGGASAGLLTGAGIAGIPGLATAGFANIWNPIGWALLAAAGIMAVIGANRDEPKFRQEETQEQTKQIGSRIDITNKQLEFVNRNLVALRQEITFILPESAFFSERRPEDRFAIDAQRGV